MALPTLAPYPTAAQRSEIPLAVWDQLIQSWSFLVRIYSQAFTSTIQNSPGAETSIADFLKAYFEQLRLLKSQIRPTQAELDLRKCAFLLVHRIVLDTQLDIPELVAWPFLADFAHAFLKTRSLLIFFDRLWTARPKNLTIVLGGIKSELIQSLSSDAPDAAIKSLDRLTPIVHASPQVGAFLMTGSDLIDALFQAYPSSARADQQRLTVFTFLCLSALYKSGEMNHSLLIDHLFSLKSQAGNSQAASLLSELVTNTSLLDGTMRAVTGKSAARASALTDALQQYKMPSIARTKPRQDLANRKGKGVQTATAHNEQQHMHQMGLITQIQELFPDLGSGFIAKLFDAYNDEIEIVTAHLLEDSLPPHLASLDRSAALPESATPQQIEQRKIEQLAPHPPRPSFSAPSTRRNIYDNDAFDRLDVDASRLHIGRKESAKTIDEDDSHKPNKLAILAALAAFDSDDDERDDTYDAADVGDTVDNARPDGEDHKDVRVSSVEVDTITANDRILYSMWKENKDLLGRTSDIKRSQGRDALRKETGMSDEMIEGWAVMIARDPKMQRRLEAASQASFNGGQNSLERTSYRHKADDDGTGTDSDHPSNRGRGGFMRGRGRGRGRGGRGNASAGAGDADSAIARQRKDQNKASRANHNRRDQRGKKMARAGFAG